ncbi:MAG: hypothetical protein QOG85_2349 [Gaiellaceae bacterium]|nr:hypothetical protein [Gaiellaceae bacterium]
MKRVLVVATAAAVIAGVTGCAGAHSNAGVPPLATRNAQAPIPADPPPSPATWPKYPHFSQHSCWGRPVFPPPPKSIPMPEMQVAPSYAPPRLAHPTPPDEIVQRFLSRLGDRRYIRGITLGSPPPAVGHNVHVLYADGHPPADALEAFVHAPLANDRNEAQHPTPAQHLAYGIAQFEAGLVAGALRDDFCTAGGVSLTWVGGDAGGMANKVFALEQRFPNPSPAEFRHRVALVGKRFGFRVVSLRLLRPEQLAPVLVVKTNRPRKAFAKKVEKIMSLLDPASSAANRTALTFEGFFFAAEDAHGRPFLFTEGISRGEGEGGEWAANRCLYPSPPIGMLETGHEKPCS